MARRSTSPWTRCHLLNDEAVLNEMDRSELLWRRFEMHVGLYKHYLELVLKVNIAFYAICGAIVTYVLAHRGDGVAHSGLFVPLVLGLGLTTIFVFGAFALRATREEMLSIRDELELKTIPEVRVLSLLLWVSSLGFLVVSLGVAVLWLGA